MAAAAFLDLWRERATPDEVVEYPTFNEGPPSQPLWQMPTGRPREVAIFCAEELRPAACVVADALVVRGYAVSLETGANARKALQLSLAGESRGLRVLCVPQALDRKTHRKLYEGLDGDLRRDLLVIPLETPRVVIDAVEARAGVKRARPHRRYTRTYLAQPTIAESRSDVRRFAGSGLLAAAGTAAVALVVGFALPGQPDAVAETKRSAPVVEPPSMLLDDAVLGATVPDTSAVDRDEPPSRTWRRRAREVARLRSALAVERTATEPVPAPSASPEPEEVIMIDDDLPAPSSVTPPAAVSRSTDVDPVDVPDVAPLEEAAPAPSRELVAPPSFGRGAPGLTGKRSVPVDPFASNPLSSSSVNN